MPCYKNYCHHSEKVYLISGYVHQNVKPDHMAYVSLWNWLNASLLKKIDLQDTVTSGEIETNLWISRIVKDIHAFPSRGEERKWFIFESLFTLRI